MPLHVSSTSAHRQEAKIVLYSLWYHHTYRCPSRSQVLSQPVHVTATYRCDDTRDCTVQFWPSDDEHVCSKHIEALNKFIIKFSASSWLILRWIIIFLVFLSLNSVSPIPLFPCVFLTHFFLPGLNINYTFRSLASEDRQCCRPSHSAPPSGRQTQYTGTAGSLISARSKSLKILHKLTYFFLQSIFYFPSVRAPCLVIL